MKSRDLTTVAFYIVLAIVGGLFVYQLTQYGQGKTCLEYTKHPITGVRGWRCKKWSE